VSSGLNYDGAVLGYSTRDAGITYQNKYKCLRPELKCAADGPLDAKGGSAGILGHTADEETTRRSLITADRCLGSRRVTVGCPHVHVN